MEKVVLEEDTEWDQEVKCQHRYGYMAFRIGVIRDIVEMWAINIGNTKVLNILDQTHTPFAS